MDDQTKKMHEGLARSQAERREQGIPLQRNPVERWKCNKASLRLSINSFCYDCCGGENHANRIRYCNVFDCYLWYVRPYSKDITREQCLAYVESK